MSSFLLLLLLLATTDAMRSQRSRLLTSLLGNYSSPSLPPSDLTVNVSVSIVSIFGLREDEVLEMSVWVRASWFDPDLSWSRDEWPVDSLILPAETVWKPDLGISNAKQLDCKDFTNRERSTVEARWDGSMSYYGYCLSETACPIVTRLFPFDEQACPVIISTHTSRPDDFRFNLTGVTYAGKDKLSVGQWSLTQLFAYSNVTSKATHGENAGYQLVTLVSILRRKPMYHVVLVIVPYCLLCALAAVVFLIEDVGMRFGVSLTILLAMSVYFMIVSQGAPQSMVMLSVLDKFLLIQMTVLVLLTFVVVLGPMICEEKTSRAPKDPEDDLDDLKVRSVRRRLKGMLRWRRRCDVVWLSVYLIVSILNGVVCLIVIPMTGPELSKSVENWSDLPFNWRVN